MRLIEKVTWPLALLYHSGSLSYDNEQVKLVKNIKIKFHENLAAILTSSVKTTFRNTIKIFDLHLERINIQNLNAAVWLSFSMLFKDF